MLIELLYGKIGGLEGTFLFLKIPPGEGCLIS